MEKILSYNELKERERYNPQEDSKDYKEFNKARGISKCTISQVWRTSTLVTVVNKITVLVRHQT